MYAQYHELLRYARRGGGHTSSYAQRMSTDTSRPAGLLHMLGPDVLRRANFSGVEHLKLMPSVVVTTILVNLLSLAMPLTVIQVYDRVVSNYANETLIALTFMLLLVGLMEGILNAIRTYFLNRSSLNFRFVSEMSAIRRMLHARNNDIANEHPARSTQRIEAIGQIADFYGSVTRILYLDLPFCALFIVVTWLIGGWLVLVPLFILVLYILTALYIGDTFKEALQGKETVETDTHHFLSVIFSRLRNIRVLGVEASMQRRFEALNERTARLNNYVSRAANHKEISAVTLSSFSSIATICAGAILAVNDEISVGSLVACSILSSRIVQPAVRFSKEWFDLKRISNALDETEGVFKLPLPYRDRNLPMFGGFDIIFENVTFPSISSDYINLNIKAGQVVIVKGDMRTNIINAIADKQPLYTGRILVGGHLPNMCRKDDGCVVSHYSVQTKPWDATVIENLTMFHKATDIAAARAVCRIIGLEKEIDQMSAGYETHLDSATYQELSTGFLQRLMIARILCQRANVIVLDNPTEKLQNSETQQILKGLTLMKHDATIVISMADGSFDEIADQIITISAKTDGSPPLAQEEHNEI